MLPDILVFYPYNIEVFISCFIFMFIIQIHIGMDRFNIQITIGANGVYAELYQWF